MAAAAVFLCMLTGCQPAMSKPSDPSTALRPGDVVRNKFPLRFEDHSFEAYCYNTVGCRVSYGNVVFGVEHGDERSPAPRDAGYRRNWNATVVGLRNFPPPAVVTWKSVDGSPHEASVDIGAIFRDQEILHPVPESEIPEGAGYGISPDIFLEVNDRTISVYMQAMIPTRQLQVPTNKESNFRNDLVLAWSRTY